MLGHGIADVEPVTSPRERSSPSVSPRGPGPAHGANVTTIQRDVPLTVSVPVAGRAL